MSTRKYVNEQYRDCIIKRINEGLSGAEIYSLVDREHKHYILKISDKASSSYNELDMEYKMLKWLSGKLPCPDVVKLSNTPNYRSILMKKLSGDTLKSEARCLDPKMVVRMYAEILTNLHSISTIDCPIEVSIDRQLNEIKNKYNTNNILDDLEDRYSGKTVGYLYDKLLELRPKNIDMVLTHGDYCLDNIIIDNSSLSGIIDVGRSGVGDRYRDIALAVRSISHMYNDELIEYFLQIYGLTNPDWRKIEFYILMDEFC